MNDDTRKKGKTLLCRKGGRKPPVSQKHLPTKHLPLTLLKTGGVLLLHPSTLYAQDGAPPHATLYTSLLLVIFVGLNLLFWLKTRRKLKRKTRELEHLKDEFLANTSHELLTPLHGIIGISESLLAKTHHHLPSNTRSQLKLIHSSGIRLTHLVDDILDFSKLKHRQLVIETTAVDIRSMTSVIFDHCQSLVGDKPIRLLNRLESGLPPVEADENRLAQILYNLVGNAIKFTHSGTVEVWALPEGDEIAIHVTDTGMGIEEHRLATLFHAYENTSSEHTSSENTGIGLGLTVTRKLVELHGGRITVASTPDQGSTFMFTLKASIKPLPHKETTPQPPPPIEPEEDEPANSNSPFHILIVDDDPINRQVLLNMLGPDGHRLTEAGDGLEALRLMEEDGPFDMILLDVMMPKMNGFDVCRKLRKTYLSHELPILFLTAKTQPEDLTTGFNVGGNDFLTKPLCRAELLARMETHLKLLDVTRNLEVKVKERTVELERHYTRLDKISQERDSKNQELESMFRIVHGVNQPGKEDLIRDRLLNEGVGLFHQADKALFFTRENDVFKVRAQVGWPTGIMEGFQLSQKALTSLYRGKALAIKQGVYLIRGSARLARHKEYAPLLPLNSALAMSVNREGKTACVLLFVQSTGDQVFDHGDVGRLKRFLLYAVTVLERTWLLSDLKERNQQMTLGLEQARLIRQSMIPSEDVLDRCVPKHFLLFQPKDDATRDFYCFFENGTSLFLAVADVGDHGITGALTCTMTLHLLSTLITEHQMRRPVEILERIHYGLRKTRTLALTLSLCRWDRDRRRLSWASAGRPIFLIKANQDQPQLECLETDPLPLGQRKGPTPFTANARHLEPDDLVYLTTDGFEKQRDKFQIPFGSERFKDVLTANAHQSMLSQKRTLQNELANYRVMEEPDDDITIIGFRV